VPNGQLGTVRDGAKSLKGSKGKGDSRIFFLNYRGSLFNDDLSNEPNFSLIYLAGQHLQAVLRIHDILGWIRILLFSSLTFKMPAKNKFFNTIFSAYYFLKVHLHNFSKIKGQKSHKIVGIKVFLTIFA
jgi:hypothetical protein